MALEGRCRRASRKAFHVPPPLCLTASLISVTEGLEPDYRDRPSSITDPPGRLLAGFLAAGVQIASASQPTRPGKQGNKILGVNAATAELVSIAFRNEGPVRCFEGPGTAASRKNFAMG